MDDAFEIVEDASGRLTLKRPGLDDATDVRPRQAFPWSGGGAMVSVRDKGGKELLLIERPADLPAGQRELIERWMGENTFYPVVRRVEKLDTDFGYQLWTVETDRGRAEFRVQEKEDLRFLPDGRFSLKDSDGNVYVLPPIETLDAHSRRAVSILL